MHGGHHHHMVGARHARGFHGAKLSRKTHPYLMVFIATWLVVGLYQACWKPMVTGPVTGTTVALVLILLAVIAAGIAFVKYRYEEIHHPFKYVEGGNAWMEEGYVAPPERTPRFTFRHGKWTTDTTDLDGYIDDNKIIPWEDE